MARMTQEEARAAHRQLTVSYRQSVKDLAKQRAEHDRTTTNEIKERDRRIKDMTKEYDGKAAARAKAIEVAAKAVGTKEKELARLAAIAGI